MEQKQLDEMDDSFFGEELVDDDLLDDEVKVSPVKEKKMKAKAKKAAEDAKASSVDSPKKEIKEIKEVKETKMTEDKTREVKEESKKAIKEVKAETKAGTAKDEPKVEPQEIVDPWADEEDDSLFKEASTWKAITGIVVILLIFSIFTQGFQFSESSASSPTGISITEAEQKAVGYVNDNLLAGAPFLAESYASEDLGEFYKVTLAIAGETVDSYISKDGKLFFPQGYDTSVALPTVPPAGAQLEGEVPVKAVEEPVENVPEEPVVKVPAKDGAKPVEVVEEPVENVPEEPVVEAPAVDVKIIPINAKRWLFQPNQLRVNKGDIVRLSITPAGLDFTFAIPELGVEKQISGQTVVEFTANKVGQFDFVCSTCEAFRGMSGSLVVE